MVSLNASPNCGTEKQLASPQITKTNTNLYVHTHHLRETQQLSAPQLEGELHRKAFFGIQPCYQEGGIATTTATHKKVARNNKVEPCKSPTKIKSCYLK